MSDMVNRLESLQSGVSPEGGPDSAKGTLLGFVKRLDDTVLLDPRFMKFSDRGVVFGEVLDPASGREVIHGSTPEELKGMLRGYAEIIDHEATPEETRAF